MSAIKTSSIQTNQLWDLSTVTLIPELARLLEVAQRGSEGSAMWRHRKVAEAHDLLRLVQISQRLRVIWLDLSIDLRVVVEMKVSTPCLPKPEGPLQEVDRAQLGIIYREESLRLPQPGYSYVYILGPKNIWHPNVSFNGHQMLCLGLSLPAGIPLREILLMTYGALTMQTVQMNPRNAAGVMNPAAAEWWQHNTKRIPLSREPFFKHESHRL